MGFLADLFRKKPRLTYELPAGWSEEKVKGGTLMLAPQLEQGWQANIFLETCKDELSRDLRTAMRDLLANLQQKKKITQVLGTDVKTLSPGVTAAVLHYLHQSEGMILREREVLVPLGSDVVFFVLTSTVDSLSTKYDPIFDRFLATLRRV